MKVIVTGGMGFIGSHFVRQLIIGHKNWEIINLDKLTYAGNPRNLEDVDNADNYTFIKGDINDHKLVEEIFSRGIDVVVNFAAESHVDRSISNPSVFLQTNVLGTQTLLDAANEYGVKKFIQISTDEVYGSILKGEFTEESPLEPSSPYSASKASADLLVKAYANTFGLNTNIVRCTNNYGPMQYPEKLIPVIILKGLKNEEIPMYGDGSQEREWIFVKDFCNAIESVLLKGREGEIYNVGSGMGKKNRELIEFILSSIGKDLKLISKVKDRLGHDLRYAVNHSKITKELGWVPRYGYKAAMEETIRWYINHKDWWGDKNENLLTWGNGTIR